MFNLFRSSKYGSWKCTHFLWCLHTLHSAIVQRIHGCRRLGHAIIICVYGCLKYGKCVNWYKIINWMENVMDIRSVRDIRIDYKDVAVVHAHWNIGTLSSCISRQKTEYISCALSHIQHTAQHTYTDKPGQMRYLYAQHLQSIFYVLSTDWLWLRIDSRFVADDVLT